MHVAQIKEYIYENKLIPKVLEELGCHAVYYDKKQNYYTACRQDGDNPKAVIISNTNYLSYMSFTQGVNFSDGKDIISYIEYKKGYDFIESLKWLHKILGLNFTIKREPTPMKSQADKVRDALYIITKHVQYKEKEKELHFIDESELDEFVPILHIDWWKEGVAQPIAKEFGVCYSYKYKRIIVPVRYWMTGELMGWTGRTTVSDYDMFGIQKYFISPGMNKSLNLFGLWENYKYIKDKKCVVVVESEKSVLKMASRGIRNVVACSGHTLSHGQIRILIGLDVDIVIAFDKDIGLKDVRYTAKQFLNIRDVYYIYDIWDILKDKESPCDRHTKVYKWLLSKCWKLNSKREKKMFERHSKK